VKKKPPPKPKILAINPTSRPRARSSKTPSSMLPARASNV